VSWSYLIHDNTEFWIPYLEASCNATLRKMSEHYDVEVEGIVDQGRGFQIALNHDILAHDTIPPYPSVRLISR
jgi:hypothetical protein